MVSPRKAIGTTLIFISGLVVGYFVGQHPFQTHSQATVETSQPGTKLHPWEMKFKVPATIQLPQDRPLVRFEIKHAALGMDDLTLTIVSLAERPCALAYKLYGYDSKGRRISESDEDEFSIAPHETVVRGSMLLTYENLGFGMLKPSSYVLMTSVEQ